MGAGSLVSDFAVGDTNFDNVMLSMNKAYKGKMSLSLTEMDSTTVPAIAAGSWSDNNGALFKFDTDSAISTTDPVTSGAIANGVIYICLIPQIGTASSATTDTAGYAIGATVITLASAGTGSILVGDVVKFAGDLHSYSVTSGDADVSDGGSITIEAPGLYTAIAASATAITLSAGGITASFTATAPTWSDSKQGWYGTGDQANYRNIARCQKYFDGYSTYYTAKQELNNETSDYREYFNKDKVISAKTASEANQWKSICWSPELSLFCAVADSGTNRVMTSPDGTTWTARAASEANSWYLVCWSPELSLFCAVSFDGTNRVMTSPDGTTWTARAASEANSWLSVCWSPELSLFYAVSYDGTNRVMTSPDGTTWTARAASEANIWLSVCWSPELSLFCAVSYDGINRVLTSGYGVI